MSVPDCSCRCLLFFTLGFVLERYQAVKMFLRGIDKALAIGFLSEKARREPAEQTDEFAGKVHFGEQLLHAALANKCANAGRSDKCLFGKVKNVSSHLLPGKAACLAELKAHSGTKFVKVAKDGLQHVNALKVQKYAAKLYWIH